ncbi:pyrimidine 5'-nucleotidase [Parasphingopyxis algicola]|uniref:pyrimidine 5'-nucleotidase n=1 Tax=Parasphingopyxis algicola TaxID=2026624 RepID=UPI0015A26B91|nr:pyrimidine 5'-nucleotidase [Parasphingopyxis algicola]QLC25549.1 pyrimidine 5'-nucleotidase [Parasphingopyxis algicola]
MPPTLTNIDHWIFDLDNTLYPASARLFDQIDVKMGDYISRLLDVDRIEARRIQKQFFHSHGTTLSGLMEAHGVEPGHFLDYVHDIDLEVIDEDRALAEAIGALPGRKFVFTNGDAPYARRVLERLGLETSFEAIHDIHACDYVPKPERVGYEAMCRTFEIKPDRALFVEDMARNLKPAKAMGMVTVWVNNGSERGSHEADSDFIDYEIAAVTPWLRGIVEAA